MNKGEQRIGVDFYPNKTPDIGPNYLFRLVESDSSGRAQCLKTLGGISNNGRYYPPDLLGELDKLGLPLDENGTHAIGIATIAVASRADLVSN